MKRARPTAGTMPARPSQMPGRREDFRRKRCNVPLFDEDAGRNQAESSETEGRRALALTYTVKRKGQSMRTVSPDGYLRLKTQELGRIPLQHLISDVDEDAVDQEARCGAAATLSGYTEWTSPAEPSLSIGWDWEWKALPGATGVVRLGLPRTNILVVSDSSVPLPWEDSLEVLANLIDAIDWQRAALNAACRSCAGLTYKN